MAVAAALVFTLAAAASVSTDAGFEGADANLASNGATDWNSFAPSWTGNKPYRQATDSTKVAGWTFTGIEDAQKPPDKSDTQFGGGVKQDDDCAKLSSTSNPPNKDDIKRIYIASATVGGHVYLALSWARIPQNTTSSSMHVGFEFNQNDPTVAANKCSTDSPLVHRSTANGGDMLIVYDFEGGSTQVNLKLLRWQTSGTCEQTGKAATSAGCWVATPSFSAWEAAVNDADATDAIAPDGSDTLHSQEFGEAIVDLTASGVFPANPTACVSFGRAFGVSRSSGNSGTAAMEDLAGPADVNISNCGKIIIRKMTSPTDTANPKTSFSYTTTAQTLPGPTAITLSSLTDGGSQTKTDVKPATGLTVTEGDPSPLYANTAIDCAVSGHASTATNISTSTSTRTVTFDLAANQVLDCTYTNTKQKQASTIDTAPWIYPNDTATVGPSGATGTVTFKLYKATGATTASANCQANGDTVGSGGLIYKEQVTLPGSSPNAVSTSNYKGAHSPDDSVKIESSQTVYWRADYSGDSSYFGRVSNCEENIASTLQANTTTGGTAPS